jgi:TPR repeat protein
MKALKIALIVLAVLILTPLVLLEVIGLYSSAHFARVEEKEKLEKAELVAQLPESGRDCVHRQKNRVSAWDVGDEKYHAFLRDWLAACERAARAAEATREVQLALADAYFAIDRRQESADTLRTLAAKGDAEALLKIYERHRSFEQGDLDRAQIITAKEAGEALRKAAELSHPTAMSRYATNLSQGYIIKRDADAAAHWMEKSMARPPRDSTPADLSVALGLVLIKSDKPEQRARGLRILESMNRADARAYLGVAIRNDDPVRARALFEETLRAWPGISLAPLAEMLIKGEGGPQDEKRALKLLQSYANASAPSSINEALGKLYAEGRLVPRDPQKAAELMGGAAQWSIDKRIALGRFLAENPSVQHVRPKAMLYDLTHAAELGEPGAMSALIGLKLSSNAQFADKAGGCALATQAARDGDETARRLLGACTN